MNHDIMKKRRRFPYQQSEGALFNRLILIGICFFVAVLAGSGFSLWVASFFVPETRDWYLAQSAGQNVIIFVGAAVAVACIVSAKPGGFLGLTQRTGWRPFAGVLIVYAIGMPFLNQLVYWNEHISFPYAPLDSWFRLMEERAMQVTDIILGSTSVGALISGILLVGVLTGFSEEMLFRGALQRSLEAYPPMRQWAIWISAIIFSAMHMQFFGFFPRLLLGAFFGYLLYSTGSLWPGVFGHALNNSIVVVTAWLERRCPDSFGEAEMWGVTEYGFPWMAFVSITALAIFFWKFYRYFFSDEADALQITITD